MINESGVSFYPGGGHSHNGENSSLIDTSVYSVYDFPVQIVGDPSRTADQIRNLDSFKQLIIDTVNQSIIAPAGVVFQQGVINGSAHIISRSISTEIIAANAITANEIAAGSITADLLAANIVLVNNVISSNNYVPGVSGWVINSDGSAEFDFAVIRGTIVADSIYINALNYWNSNGTFSVGNANNLMVYDGTNLQLTGGVTATFGQIAGWVIVGDNLETGGNFAGSMQLGEFTGTNGAAGVFIEGAADVNSQYGIAELTGDYLYLANTATGNELIAYSSGIQYAGTHNNSNSVGNYSYSFYYNGTNVYARLYNVVNNSYFDVCLTNCGAGTTSATTTAATTTAATTTTATTTAATTTTTTPTPPECSDNSDCPPGRVCVGGTCVNQTTTTTTTTTTTPAPTYNGSTCNPGDLGSYGCTFPSECVSDIPGRAKNCNV